jgi:excisionase family DNA binding protein
MITIENRAQVFLTEEKDQPLIDKIEDVLETSAKEPVSNIKLTSASGEALELPQPLFNLLSQVVYYLAQGKAVSILPVDKELTTQEAADLLNVSRPYIVKLLDEGKIPFSKVGAHRRIRFDDFMEYRKQYKEQQRQARIELDKITLEGGFEDY